MGGSARALAILVAAVSFSGVAAADPDYTGPAYGTVDCVRIVTDISDKTGVVIATDGGVEVLVDALGLRIIFDATGVSCFGDDAGERSAEAANAATSAVISELLDPILP